jgi:enoyl-CoA hydratase/carnithine racemase
VSQENSTPSALVHVEVEDSLAIFTLQRGKQLNALNRALLTELGERIEGIRRNSTVRTVLLRGEGRAFAAGADIAEMQSLRGTEAEEFSRLGQQVFSSLESLPVVTIALIHGYALGGGLELAMACDIRIAAEGTKFGQPEVILGVTPGFGGSQRLPRLIGQGRALHLLLTGEQISAVEALDMGLVTKVVPSDDLLTTGRELANKFLSCGPHALTYVKRAVYEGAEVDLSKGLAMESTLFGLSFSTDDQKEGMAAFVERRKPEFTGK